MIWKADHEMASQIQIVIITGECWWCEGVGPDCWSETLDLLGCPLKAACPSHLWPLGCVLWGSASKVSVILDLENRLYLPMGSYEGLCSGEGPWSPIRAWLFEGLHPVPAGDRPSQGADPKAGSSARVLETSRRGGWSTGLLTTCTVSPLLR